MLPATTDTGSHLRCPRSSCEDFHRSLVMSIGQHEDRGDLVVEHRCPTCGYSESGPSTVTAARRTSPVVRTAVERLRKLRSEGVPLRLAYDQTPWPKGEFDA